MAEEKIFRCNLCGYEVKATEPPSICPKCKEPVKKLVPVGKVVWEEV
jgi:rubrerythrin